MFNNEQIKGMLERFATILATWFLTDMVRRGWIKPEDSGVILPGLVILIVAAPSLLYGFWINTTKNLQQAAASTPNADGTKPIIITSAAIAAATPDSNIVSKDTNTVVAEADVVTKPASVVIQPEGKA